jgi:hypothetical protein
MSHDLAQVAIERLEKSYNSVVSEAYIFFKPYRTEVVFCFTSNTDNWRHYALTSTSSIIRVVGLDEEDAMEIVQRFREMEHGST